MARNPDCSLRPSSPLRFSAATSRGPQARGESSSHPLLFILGPDFFLKIDLFRNKHIGPRETPEHSVQSGGPFCPPTRGPRCGGPAGGVSERRLKLLLRAVTLGVLQDWGARAPTPLPTPAPSSSPARSRPASPSLQLSGRPASFSAPCPGPAACRPLRQATGRARAAVLGRARPRPLGLLLPPGRPRGPARAGPLPREPLSVPPSKGRAEPGRGRGEGRCWAQRGAELRPQGCRGD